MRRKVACFFPHNVHPPETGAHRRCLEVLAALRELGCSVTLLSSPFSSHTPWDRAAIDGLRRRGVADVKLYELSPGDYVHVRVVPRLRRLLEPSNPLNGVRTAPPGMRAWFTRTVADLSPDVILMHYANWDGLVDHERFASTLRIMENYDLVTLNLRMWREAKKHLPDGRLSAADVGDEVLDESFYAKRHLEAHPDEYRIYDRYDYTVAISDKEAGLIRRNTRKSRVVLIPATYEPRPIRNSYTGAALLPTGPNIFNLQGCLYFIKKVLPRVLQSAPSFSLQVTGFCCGQLSPAEGLVLSGYVPDIQAVYQSARFLVCPIFGGTGQQVKIVEAMSCGVPVVALRAAAEPSPICHEVNGLVAGNAEEFADHVLRLWNDPALCRRFGEAARETIAAEFSRERLLEGFSALVGRQRVEAIA